ncbi:TRAP transporter substrate-binding protein [Pseudemcibacter aquimaris]|uniref:TRAP transporter substrate-binding protein n=1 Tax=Pseudemcibacter aquimaris TaxID=2857064 RepID=UPI002012D924|nr:TRAP transporter substrate-binding protein [Pseudemcibacter aquimaris]MCC3860792.1 TRAP transporter substrate-binding protein [Pseudemcibacter aquimaris]WDU59612.1 TRAP transporter substrate-binding protein [Pseudemcibacter aquimaris]
MSAFLFSCGTPENTETVQNQDNDPVNLKLASTYPSTLTILGTMAKRFEEQIAIISNGNITFRFFEPGALSPPLETFDAVSYGALDSAWSSPGFWSGKVPALQTFAAIPFGPDAPEYMAWYYEGGGKEIYEDIYHQHNIHGIICGISPPEASGWFKEEIKTLDDLKGLRMRFFGLGARVMSKLGVSTQLLATGDIFPALELGAIDATEFSVPAVDEKLGFDKVAKHYYFPGWHQQSTFFELMINLEKWESLSDLQKAQINMTCGDNMRFGIANGEALQAEAINKLKQSGTIFHEWPGEIMQAFEAAWLEVAEEEAAKDPDFKRAWESLQSFRASYKSWKDLGYIKADN